MNVRAIDFIALSVADMDRAATFYRDILGLDIPPGDAGHPMHAMWRELDTSPVTIALSLTPRTPGRVVGLASRSRMSQAPSPRSVPPVTGW